MGAYFGFPGFLKLPIETRRDAMKLKGAAHLRRWTVQNKLMQGPPGQKLNPTVEAAKVFNMTILQSQTKERMSTSVHHSTSMFQRFGVDCMTQRSLGNGGLFAPTKINVGLVGRLTSA